MITLVSQYYALSRNNDSPETCTHVHDGYGGRLFAGVALAGIRDRGALCGSWLTSRRKTKRRSEQFIIWDQAHLTHDFTGQIDEDDAIERLAILPNSGDSQRTWISSSAWSRFSNRFAVSSTSSSIGRSDISKSWILWKLCVHTVTRISPRRLL